eukprot:12510153-Ditylum_brightwellii.AAC.1
MEMEIEEESDNDDKAIAEGTMEIEIEEEWDVDDKAVAEGTIEMEETTEVEEKMHAEEITERTG